MRPRNSFLGFCLLLAANAAIAAGTGQRQAFFGELHLHTSYSFDAFGFSPSRIDPDTAYRFARGDAQGSSQLVAAWTDPDFDPRQRAVYYLRVLEVETLRWTARLADRHGLPRPQRSAATIRERAWSSPIWHTPVAASR